MKLNLHILAYELAFMVKSSKLSEKSELSIFSARIAFDKDTNWEEDVVYIVSEDTLEFTSLNDGKHQMLVISSNDPDKTLYKVQGECLIFGADTAKEQLFKEVCAVFERYNRWEDSVESAITQGASLEHILELGFSMIGNPLALCDTSLHRIATHRWDSVPVYNSLGRAISEPGYANIYLNALLQEANLLEKVRGEPHAFVYQLEEDNYKVLHLNIFSGKQRIAYLVTVATLSPIDMRVCSIANRFGELLAFALNASSVMKRHNPYNIDVLSQRILAGEAPDKTYVQYMLEQIGWRETDSYCVFEFEMLDDATSHNLMTDISLFKTAIRDSSIFCYRAGIIVIHNLTKSRQDYATLVLMLQELLHRRLYAGGGSDVFTGYANLQLYEKEAFYALGYSKKFISGGKSKITAYQECLLDNFFDLCASNLDLRLLCRSDIREIWIYDKINKTSYIETIYTYLTTGKSLVESAKLLYVHRNTIVHRLNKIIDILGKDIFSSEESALELLLSCKVLAYLEKKEYEK